MNRGCLFYVLRLVSSRNTDRGGRRVRAALLSVALALVPLVTVVEVADGMIEGITQRYLEVGTFHLQVRFFGGQSREEIGAIAERVRTRDEVVSASLVVEGIGLAIDERRRLGVTVRSYESEYIARDPGFRRYLSVRGSIPEARADEVALSAGTADELGVQSGDRIGLIVARTLSSGRFVLKKHTGTVSGVFSTGYADLDGQTVLVSEKTASELFPDGRSMFIGVKVEKPFGALGSVARSIQRDLPDGAYTYTWRELERGMFSTFETTRTLLVIVMSVIVCVAAITISSSLFILVAERESEIALLRSVGARGRDIRRAFVVLGCVTGTIGTAVGVAAGVLLAININEVFQWAERLGTAVSKTAAVLSGTEGPASGVRILDPAFYLERIPVSPELKELLLISASAIALSVLSAWIPARRAGRIQPSRSLTRH